jgi:hypothetical protein
VDGHGPETGGVSRSGSSGGEVYIEFIPVGNVMKVCAVDAATGLEVSVMGPLTASRASLQQLAVRKLQSALSRRPGRSS